MTHNLSVAATLCGKERLFHVGWFASLHSVLTLWYINGTDDYEHLDPSLAWFSQYQLSDSGPTLDIALLFPMTPMVDHAHSN
jgi:hypothetical protein